MCIYIYDIYIYIYDIYIYIYIYRGAHRQTSTHTHSCWKLLTPCQCSFSAATPAKAALDPIFMDHVLRQIGLVTLGCKGFDPSYEVFPLKVMPESPIKRGPLHDQVFEVVVFGSMGPPASLGLQCFL